MNKHLIGVLAASLSLVACGGGGSSQTTSPAATSVVSHGTITGFGSVIIDGVRYETSQAQFSVDGSSGRSQADLSVGQRVTVRGRINADGSRSADDVDYEAELHGIVSSIDLAGGSFIALGQTVRVDAATIFDGVTDLAGLLVGDYIEISGYRAADGGIVASYVQKEDARSELEVKGFIAGLDSTAKTFSIGSQLVDYSNASLSPAGFVPGNDLFVEVEGSLNGSVLVASKVAQDDDFGDTDSGTQAEVEGLVSGLAVDRSSFQVGPTRVTVSSATVYEDGVAGDLADGARIEAKGTIQADGSLAATRIEFKLGLGDDGDSSGDAEAQATITAIDTNARSITVLGVSVQMADTTVYRDSRDELTTFGFASLAVGDYVELGLVEVDGALVATRLERDATDSEQFIKAAVDSVDGTLETLTIAGVSVDASNAIYRFDDTTVSQSTFYGSAVVGSQVKAKGSYSGTTLVASEVELDVDN